MARIQTVRLHFSAPVHLGVGRLTDGAYAFDAATLFSALFLEALCLGCSDDLLEAARNGGLQLSDGFPYIGDDLYLPKPMAVRDTAESGNSTADTLAKKATKRLPFIRSSQYQAFLDARMDSLQELKHFQSKLGRSFLQTKVNLTREHKEDAEPYHVGGYRFLPGCGIYFLVSGGYDLMPLLDQLQYSGIGGERSSGYGRFSYEITDENPLTIARGSERVPTSSVPQKGSRSSKKKRRKRGSKARPKPSSGAASAMPASVVDVSRPRGHVLLATATPSRDELTDYLLKDARYKLVRRGGFVLSAIHSPTAQKKRDLYLFQSGSMFARTFEGDVFDVNATPGAHPVYRYARAMWMEV